VNATVEAGERGVGVAVGELLELGEGRFDVPLVARDATCSHGEQSGGIRGSAQLGPFGERLDP
jgi:hypothetical protein